MTEAGPSAALITGAVFTACVAGQGDDVDEEGTIAPSVTPPQQMMTRTTTRSTTGD